ncbi:MAG: ABC transporter substrate-binding protein, partial [Spirochaetia bacterium]
SGWQKDAEGWRSKDGSRATLTFLYPSGDSVRQAIAAQLVDQTKALGIVSTFEGVDWDSGYKKAQSNPLIWGWGTHSPMEVYTIYHSQSKTGLARYSPYKNEAADTVMDLALGQSNLEKSFQLWQSAQDIFAQDVPWIWLVNIDHLYWCKKGLYTGEQKLHPHGHGWSIVNNVDTWAWD